MQIIFPSSSLYVFSLTVEMMYKSIVKLTLTIYEIAHVIEVMFVIEEGKFEFNVRLRLFMYQKVLGLVVQLMV